MPKFSMSRLRTKTLRAPLTKLSCDNIYPHCACSYQTPLCCANISHNTHAIIMNVHTVHTSYAYAHCTMLNLARAPAHQHFFARRQNLVRAPACQYLVAQCRILPITIFSLHIMHFSAPIYAHSFLCASIPPEFCCRN
jgi:hypothetical protein